MSAIAVAVRRIPNSVEIVVVMTLAFGWYIYRSTRWTLMEYKNAWWYDSHVIVSFIHNNGPIVTILSDLIVFAVVFLFLRQREWTVSDLNLESNWKFFAHGIIMFSILAVLSGVFFYLDTVFTPVVSCRFPAYGEEVGGIFWVLMMIVDPVYHEFFLLCYLFKRLDKWNPVAIIALSTLIRLSYQVYFGPFGWALALVFGIISAWYYYKVRTLTAPIVLHFLWNFVGVAS